VEIVAASATTGDGIGAWYDWIDARATELPR
jgi:hypothetical protein